MFLFPGAPPKPAGKQATTARPAYRQCNHHCVIRHARSPAQRAKGRHERIEGDHCGRVQRITPDIAFEDAVVPPVAAQERGHGCGLTPPQPRRPDKSDPVSHHIAAAASPQRPQHHPGCPPPGVGDDDAPDPVFRPGQRQQRLIRRDAELPPAGVCERFGQEHEHHVACPCQCGRRGPSPARAPVSLRRCAHSPPDLPSGACRALPDPRKPTYPRLRQ